MAGAAFAWPVAGRRVWLAGHRGLLGTALHARLCAAGAYVIVATRAELDLRRPEPVAAFLAAHRPDAVVLAAGTVGGIATSAARPAEFLADNLAIAAAVIPAAHAAGIGRLVYVGSSAAYPEKAPDPIGPESLLDGPLAAPNQWYALAKIAGAKLCEAYRRQHAASYVAAMPTNLYGPHDRFDLDDGHVLAALMRRIDRAARAGAAEVVVWGSGRPRREFLYVEDAADALVHVLERYDEPLPINIGTGSDVTIAELATMIATVAGFRGRLVFDPAKPDGAMRKRLDVAALAALGWRPRVPLAEGLARTWAWYRANCPPPEADAN